MPTVLVVDDSPVRAGAIRSALERLGCQVGCALGAGAAKALLERDDVDLLVTGLLEGDPAAPDLFSWLEECRRGLPLLIRSSRLGKETARLLKKFRKIEVVSETCTPGTLAAAAARLLGIALDDPARRN